MKMSKKVGVAVAAGAAVIAIAAGAVLASGADDDAPLKGSDYDKATAAALAEVGGGTVLETEVGDDGAAYGVEIRKDDGTVVEVSLDRDFKVIGSEQDDDGPNDQEDGPNDD